MKKIPVLLLVLIATVVGKTATAQTTVQATPKVNGMAFNASDYHIPPAVLHYLETHPSVARKVIAYYKKYGHLPPPPGSDIAKTGTANVVPAQVAYIPVPVQPAADVAWPKAPAIPANVPVVAAR